jgi:hypothetical protein
MSSQPTRSIASGDTGMLRALAAETCAGLAEAHGGSFDIRVDRDYPHRAVRYVATARSLGIRPYAVITADAGELRRALTAGGGGR